MSKPLTVRLPDDLREWLTAYAEEAGLTRTQVVVAGLTAIRDKRVL